MNKKIKKKWIRALKTGEINGKPIVQHTGALRSTEKPIVTEGEHKGKKARGLCCLGVLCELAVAEGIIPKPFKNGDSFLYGESLDISASLLPQSVVSWAGLKSRDPGDSVYSLAEYNDWRGYNFKKIAKVIKEGL